MTTPDRLELAPFRALRYDPRRVSLGNVLAPPYDVISEDERQILLDRDPHNAVRLVLPPEPEGGGSPYAAARDTLRSWRERGVLVADPRPALYVYEQTADGHVQRGLVGALRLVAPDAGVVLPHENTMAGPVADRLALTEATDANLEPIFLVYDGRGGAASELVASVAAQAPLLSAATPDGVAHRVWAVTDPDRLAAVAADLAPRRAVIADGHHRYATFLRHQADRRASGSDAGPWDLGLALLVDGTAFGPQVHAIHRVVHGLPVARAAELAARLFTVRPLQGSGEEVLAELARAGESGPAFVAAGGTEAYLLTEPKGEALAELPADQSAAWRGLDVTVAHYLLIRAGWGLTDDERVVGYRHDTASALAAAQDGDTTALLLNPTPVESVMAVAAAGERMPRKSTLFTPKPASGLLMRVFADQV